jgi:hypothetical protein
LPRAARAAAIGAPLAADLEGERRQILIHLGCSARSISASHPGFAQLALELFTPFLLLAAASLIENGLGLPFSFSRAGPRRSSSAFGCASRSVKETAHCGAPSPLFFLWHNWPARFGVRHGGGPCGASRGH